MSDHTPSRRDFLAGSAAVIGAAATAGPALAADKTRTARIVQIEHAGACTGKTSLDDAIVERMIKTALMTYAGTASAPEALAKYFDPKQKIAIKINTLGSPYSSVNPIVAFTVANLLHEMGAPKDNIRIFDQYQSRMRKGRYRLRRKAGDIWVTNHLGRTKEKHTYVDGKRKVDFHWDRMIEWPDAVLNLCIPKDHDLTGVTGALKNMAMGCVKPTAAYYNRKEGNPGHYTIVPRFHRNNCDPALAWLYSRPMIKDKVKLIMADALRVLYHGGPQDKARWRTLNNQIWVTEDPVACDTTILHMVNGIRKEKGMVPVEEAKFRGKPISPRYLKTCAEYGLGVHDTKRITIDKKVLT